MAPRSLFVLLLALAAAGSAIATYCELTDDTVCGADGIEYTNRCVAEVQGVKVAYRGECGSSIEESSEESSARRRLLTEESSEESSHEESSVDESSFAEFSPVEDPGVYITRTLRETSGRVPFSDILSPTFGPLGYRFVGRYLPRAGQPSATIQRPGVFARGRSAALRGAALDRRGNHYVQPTGRTPRTGAGFVPPRTPITARRLMQEIGIIGANDLKPTPTTTFPYTAVVSMVFSDGDSKTRSGCSASFIAPSVLLTSAHCLYDDVKEYFYAIDGYSFFTASGTQLKASVDKVFVTTEFILGVPEYDVGVIVLDKSFENELGYLGRGQECGQKEDVALLGYPLDVTPNGVLYQSTCSVRPVCDVVLLGHQCDDAPGMSGGPLLTRDDNVVRAVVLGALDADTNTAVALTPEILTFITESIEA